MFLFQKYKKIVFSLYYQKQVYENRKQKLLPNITLHFKIYQMNFISLAKFVDLDYTAVLSARL